MILGSLSPRLQSLVILSGGGLVGRGEVRGHDLGVGLHILPSHPLAAALSGRVLPFTGAPCPFCPQKPLSQAIRASQGRDPWALGSRALLCSPCRYAVGVSGAAARMLTAQVSHLLGK